MFITIKDVAKAAGCSTENVNYHLKKGHIPFLKAEHGHILIRQDLLPMIRNIVKKGQKQNSR